MQYRHEIKHEIDISDMLILRQRLRAVMKPDEHAKDGRYLIRSLYFDNLYDKALREKIDGVDNREKFRIRYYNGDLSFICLEKKIKRNGLCGKLSAQLTEAEAQKIAEGDTAWMHGSDRPLVEELYSRMHGEGLRPQTIVDYTREPFVFAPGNVRVTLDYDIRTGIRCTDFLNPGCMTVPVADSPSILEVKWDGYLPDIIRDAVQLGRRHSSAFSKYMACRAYD